MVEEHKPTNIANARQLRRKATDAEQLLWRHLRMRQLFDFKFRRQQPVGSYIVDFICLEQRLIIELDGGQHIDQADYDEKRTAWLKGRGYRVLRYWNHDVLKATEVVIADILEKIETGE